MRRIAAVLFATLPLAAQELSELSLPPSGDNQRAEVTQWIGPVKVSIAYHSPRVHYPASGDRTGHIWGELVRYGFFDEGFGPSTATPWRAGANESTTITLSHDVRIAGKDLKAGVYALFLDVEASGPWNWIFSRNIGWGSYQYDARNDALRVPATPEDAPFTEFLTFGFDNRLTNSADAFLQWEKKRVALRIEVPNATAIYVDQMRRELQLWPGFNYRNWQNAAQFCADNKVNLDEALVWAEKAISSPFRGAAVGHEEFGTLQTKAAVLRALGREPEADAVMDKALALPGTKSQEIYRYGMTLLSKHASKAMEVFQLNCRLHPEEKFWTFVGLARAYTAAGDKPHAIENWEVVIANVPPDLKAYLPQFNTILKNLKESR
jgi:tetratricopeptide (TPR) repeat protein